MRLLIGILIGALPCISFSQDADKLISGPGSTLTENKCKICHELAHIRRTPLSRGEWSDNLRNMKERGTPMSEDEQKIILEYLATYYNREHPAPAPGPDTLASAEADPMKRLLDAHACSGCHALERKVVGPSFREIAAKYPAEAAASLARKIREGSQGAWGPVPMPPNAGVPEGDAAKLAAWVLQQR